MDKKEKELVKSIKKNLSDLGKCLNYLDNGQVGYDDESMEETFDRLSPKMSVCFKKIRKDLTALIKPDGSAYTLEEFEMDKKGE